ncbi:MAG: DUF4386 family protein [Anaerolineae bacterium]
MRGRSSYSLAGTASVLAGLSFVVVIITLFLNPAESLRDPAEYWAFLANDPNAVLLQVIESWALGLGSLLAIAVVLVLLDHLRSQSETWIRWTSILALVGFAVFAINSFTSIAADPARAAAYATGGAAVRAAIEVTPLVVVDQQGWVAAGTVGLWLLTVSLVGLRSKEFSWGLHVVGILSAAAYWILIALLTLNPELIGSPASSLFFLVPLWYLWMGVTLLRLGPIPAEP